MKRLNSRQTPWAILALLGAILCLPGSFARADIVFKKRDLVITVSTLTPKIGEPVHARVVYTAPRDFDEDMRLEIKLSGDDAYAKIISPETIPDTYGYRYLVWKGKLRKGDQIHKEFDLMINKKDVFELYVGFGKSFPLFESGDEFRYYKEINIYVDGGFEVSGGLESTRRWYRMFEERLADKNGKLERFIKTLDNIDENRRLNKPSLGVQFYYPGKNEGKLERMIAEGDPTEAVELLRAAQWKCDSIYYDLERDLDSLIMDLRMEVEKYRLRQRDDSERNKPDGGALRLRFQMNGPRLDYEHQALITDPARTLQPMAGCSLVVSEPWHIINGQRVCGITSRGVDLGRERGVPGRPEAGTGPGRVFLPTERRWPNPPRQSDELEIRRA